MDASLTVRCAAPWRAGSERGTAGTDAPMAVTPGDDWDYRRDFERRAARNPSPSRLVTIVAGSGAGTTDIRTRVPLTLNAKGSGPLPLRAVKNVPNGSARVGAMFVIHVARVSEHELAAFG